MAEPSEPKGPLRGIIMDHTAYCSALTHAGTSFEFEVMGLMIGKIVSDGAGGVRAHVRSCLSLIRPERWTDRVEILPQRLWQANDLATWASCTLDDDLRVLGWYHSHPRITVAPSRIDIKTQWSFQQMDPTFCGVIFALFGEKDPMPMPNLKMRAFQANSGADGELGDVEVPFEIAPRLTFPAQAKTKAGTYPPPLFSDHLIDSMIRIAEMLREEEAALMSNKSGTGSDTQTRLDSYSMSQNNLAFAGAVREVVQTTVVPLIMQFDSRANACMQYLEDIGV